MNKTELLALAKSLGVAVDDSMTVAQITALITAKQASVAVATNAPAIGSKGKSIVVGFHYRKQWCHVSLKNGVSGIVGDSTAFTFPAMMSLKGTQTVVSYERLEDRDGYQRYRLEWSLE